MNREAAPIRAADPGDAVRLAELTTQLGYPVEPADIERRLARRGVHVLIALDGADGDVIGWIQVGVVTTLEAGTVAVIHGLVVDERHRSAGIGAQLLEAGEAWARAQGIGSMLVRSRETREAAHQFYERHGYRLEKRSHVFAKPLV